MKNPFPNWLSFRNCLLGLLFFNIFAIIFVYFLLLSLPFFVSFSITLIVSVLYLGLLIVMQFQALYNQKKAVFAIFVCYWLILLAVNALAIVLPQSQVIFFLSVLTTAPFAGFTGAMTLLSTNPMIQLVPYVFFLSFTLFIWWISERSQKV